MKWTLFDLLTLLALVRNEPATFLLPLKCVYGLHLQACPEETHTTGLYALRTLAIAAVGACRHEQHMSALREEASPLLIAAPANHLHLITR